MRLARTSSRLRFASCAATISQNLDGLVVAPIMEDSLQQVRISAGGKGLKEVCADQLASSRYIRVLDLASTRNHRRLIAENTRGPWAALENASQERPVTAGNVDDLGETREVVSVEYRRLSSSVESLV